MRGSKRGWFRTSKPSGSVLVVDISRLLEFLLMGVSLMRYRMVLRECFPHHDERSGGTNLHPPGYSSTGTPIRGIRQLVRRPWRFSASSTMRDLWRT